MNILLVLYLVIINECTRIYHLSNHYFTQISWVSLAAFYLLQDFLVNFATMSLETPLKLWQLLRLPLFLFLPFHIGECGR